MKKYDLLTLDIWDTVLSRRCHPDEVKIHTAHVLIEKAGELLRTPKKSAYLLFKERQRVEAEIGARFVNNGFDDEYLLSEVIEQWLLNETVCARDELLLLSSELIAEEFEQEKRVTYLNKNLIVLLEGVDFKDLAFVSDFYMPAEKLAILLEHNGWTYPYSKIFCSCDYRFNKRSGRLFDIVLEEMSVREELNHLHIGDNQHSDYVMPRSKNIEALLFLQKSDYRRRKEIDRQFLKRQAYNADYSELFYRLVQDATAKLEPVNEVQKFGHRAGFVFLSFVMFVMENAIEKGVDRVFYFTREGQFFKKIHDRLRESGLLPFGAPKSELLEVSRLATFGPTLKELSADELKRIWNQYSEQSPKAFFSSINIDASIWLPYIEKYQLDPDKRGCLFENSIFLTMLADTHFHSDIIENLGENKALLLQYLGQIGFPYSGDAVIVDIGWRGTIQDNLAYLLPKTHIHGVYLGLQGFLNDQPENTSKTAWIADLNRSSDSSGLLKTVTPLEMLCNGPGGSVTGYVECSGRIRAVRELIMSEDIIYDEFTKYFQEGVFDIVDVFAQFVRDRGLRSCELQSMSIRLMQKIIQCPEERMVDAYFNLMHNERFGTGELDQKSSNLPVSELLKALYNKKYRSELRLHILESGWPQGLIYKSKVPLLLRIYNKRYA